MKTVKIQETGRHAHFGQDPQFLDVVTHLRPQRAPARPEAQDMTNEMEAEAIETIDYPDL